MCLLHCQGRVLEPVCQLSNPQVSPLNSPNFHLFPPLSRVNKHSSIAYSVPGAMPTFKAPKLLILTLVRESPKIAPLLCLLLPPQAFLSSLFASCVYGSFQDRVGRLEQIIPCRSGGSGQWEPGGVAAGGLVDALCAAQPPVGASIPVLWLPLSLRQ